MRHKLVRAWILPLAIAALATWSVRAYLVAAARQPPPVETAPVVVVAAEVAGRAMVTAGHVTLREMPVAFIPAGAVSQLGDAVGRMARVPLYPGEILLSSKLAPPGETPGLVHGIPAGKRAVTIQVNEIVGVGGFIEPGHRVDIIATFDQELMEVDRSQLLLQDILVLAVAQATGARHGPVQEVRAYTSVTLAVTPQDATRLVLADERGSLRLLLRPWGDHQVVPFTETTTTQLRRR
jgi:pilus assembly protein CpaB